MSVKWLAIVFAAIFAPIITDQPSRLRRIRRAYAEIDSLERDRQALSERQKDTLVLTKFICFRDLRCERYPEKVLEIPRNRRMPKAVYLRNLERIYSTGHSVFNGQRVGEPVSYLSPLFYSWGVEEGDIILAIEDEFLVGGHFSGLADKFQQARIQNRKCSLDVLRDMKIMRLKFFVPPKNDPILRP